MSRLLFWIALACLVVAAVRSKLRQAAKRHQQMEQPEQREQIRPQPNRARAEAAANAETMLCCAHCGVYFPASENVPAGGRDYCSAAHAQLSPQ
ncbi:hypothetical protein GJ700_22935 [Duganella sp. FT92W]|uniref:Deaminase n=1 Tax=Pseudoduganella rivuli TaxID=2666085 RepID=A0A7X2IRB8_9BURK|nr:PP0621 family protein [Pseudoduganella rivuli]MRV74569.1 hypothetical protein [Pseudoduganella rivuli]